jgi:hypothetical protein
MVMKGAPCPSTLPLLVAWMRKTAENGPECVQNARSAEMVSGATASGAFASSVTT